MSEHEHYWRHARVHDGKTLVAGRRCDCGMETIGGLNAQVVRASDRFITAMGEALGALGKSQAEYRRRHYER